MLESLALFFIIITGVCYSFKTLLSVYDRFKTHRAKVRFIKAMSILASVPTEIKKPRTKKKGK